MQREKVPENRRGMKRVPTEQVVVGDWIYRKGPDGDYMMIVEHLDRGVYEGREAICIAGSVYKLAGKGAGPQAIFLAEAQAHPIEGGPYQWFMELGGKATKGCSLADSDFEMP
ncbi:MAG: hypothetical protein AB7G47_10115 [Mycolicibacterium sp.]|uniref:hypothetical protein n=1 Tax=Mycolicibacterium sp. TaxID=2320850 RepID=UPI003D0AD5C6